MDPKYRTVRVLSIATAHRLTPVGCFCELLTPLLFVLQFPLLFQAMFWFLFIFLAAFIFLSALAHVVAPFDCLKVITTILTIAQIVQFDNSYIGT